jgi:5-methylcytosine-specific restriction endonuclease McrA
MDYGTASSLLRSQTLFRLAQLTGYDRCIRCPGKILDASDMSLDHRIAWLDRPVDLFWDLSNLGLSHKGCNKGSTRQTSVPLIEYQNSEAKKRAQLGMPHSTAYNRLRKRFLFMFVRMLGRDTCFRCRQPILTVLELSLDHIRDWLYVDRALFWDQNNIAFSHRDCNSRYSRPEQRAKVIALSNAAAKAKNTKRGPVGTSWCWSHQSFLPLAEFTNNKSRWDGVEEICRSCRRRLRSTAADA